jgi:hypothetical protein
MDRLAGHLSKAIARIRLGNSAGLKTVAKSKIKMHCRNASRLRSRVEFADFSPIPPRMQSWGDGRHDIVYETLDELIPQFCFVNHCIASTYGTSRNHQSTLIHWASLPIIPPLEKGGFSRNDFSLLVLRL